MIGEKNNIISKIWIDVVFIIICLLTTLPFLLLLGISFSNERDIVYSGYSLIPKHFDLSAYQYVFKNPTAILKAYGFTAFTSFTGTFLSVFMMSLIAYPLSIKKFRLRNFFSMYLFVTMIFSGGMAGGYIINAKYLHLSNTPWIFILPGTISAWYVIILRTFFQGIPNEIKESARIDGASHWRIFFSMILPLSKPALATVALMTLLAKWNDWMTCMLYITNNDMLTIQYLLQRIMENIKLLEQVSQIGMASAAGEIPSETVRMAMAVIAAGPMIMVFPFFQKYFTKGLTVGSVKG